MDQTGTNPFNLSGTAIKAFARQLSVAGVAEQEVRQSRQNKVFEKKLNDSVSMLSTGIAASDAFLCLGLEKVCILFERDFFSTTAQDEKRLDKQLSENGSAVLSARLVFDAEKYKHHVEEVYGPNRKIIFPPAGESCVTILQKQIQQLSRPKSGITTPTIKEFYSARQANLRCALNLCIEAQCKALDIPVPKQKQVGRGLEI